MRSVIRVFFLWCKHLPKQLGNDPRILRYERKERPGPTERGELELDCMEISVRSDGSWALRFACDLEDIIVYHGGSESTRASHYTNAMGIWARSMGNWNLIVRKDQLSQKAHVQFVSRFL